MVLNGWALAYRKYALDYIGQEEAAQAAHIPPDPREYSNTSPIFRSAFLFSEAAFHKLLPEALAVGTDFWGRKNTKTTTI